MFGGWILYDTPNTEPGGQQKADSDSIKGREKLKLINKFHAF
ncbi:hypothetical protein IMCC12053_1167 [Celeribacter marinus]|uniref:Uncharacterized protein n=1 Tax=Celeribacter marinus TaxID=1397108 RepID=A0A0P0A985_9RHOB|nr:hypothetical protein IMCC12053_1167 [Celeribacter marinus]